MVTAQQIRTTQLTSVPATTTAAQLDISTLLASLMPLIMLMMVMMMLMPMMKGMAAGFQSAAK